MILAHIAAMSKNRVIGQQGDLPWKIPEDMKFFKEKTTGHILIMGRKTYESFNGALPNRLNIVITRQENYNPQADNARVAKDFDSAVKLAKSLMGEYGEEVFVTGGGEIYRQTIDIVDRIYLTIIDKEFEGDTVYPDFDRDQFDITRRENRYDPVPFTFYTFQRRDN